MGNTQSGAQRESDDARASMRTGIFEAGNLHRHRRRNQRVAAFGRLLAQGKPAVQPPLRRSLFVPPGTLDDARTATFRGEDVGEGESNGN